MLLIWFLVLSCWQIQTALAEASCYEILTELSGEVSSPDSDGDGFYDPDALCIWYIIASENKLVQLITEKFQFSEGCNKDYLKIWDGSNFKGTYCFGNEPPENFTSESRVLKLEFQSDKFFENEGFTATFNMVDDPTCGYAVGYRTGLFGTSNVDENGLYPVVDCTWSIITKTNGSVVDLWIMTNDLPIDCDSSHLKVYDSASLEVVVCGSFLPAVIQSTTPDLYVHLISKAGFEDAQFSARYLINDPKCGGFIKTFPGTLTSPDEDLDGKYEVNLDCVWVLVAPEEETIVFTFNSFEIEAGGPTCQYDILELYDGTLHNRTSFYCGLSSTVTLLPVRSETNTLIVRFVSDHLITKTGFSAAYRISGGTTESTTVPVVRVCGGSFYELALSFMPPDADGDGLYDSSITCSWRIHAAENKLIKLTIMMMDIIQQYEKCEYGDNLVIVDGTIDKGLYCGTTPPDVIISETRLLIIKFQSLWSSLKDKGKGFLAHYDQINDTQCGFTTAFLAGTLGSFEVDENGLFSDMEEKCTWRIDPGIDDYVALLRIIDMDIDCSSNSLKVYSDAVLGEYCGTVPPSEEFSESFLFVQLKTWDKLHSLKFTIVYATGNGECLHILTDETEMVTSPDSDNDGLYDENVDCTWVIGAPPEKIIIFEFDYIDIEDYPGCRYDYIEFYDTHQMPENLLDKFCGDSATKVTSLLRTLIVRFVSDEYLSLTGFSASFKFKDSSGGIDFPSTEDTGMITESTTATIDLGIIFLTTPVNTHKSSSAITTEDIGMTKEYITTTIDSVLRVCGGSFWEPTLLFMPPDSDGDGLYDDELSCVWRIYAAENKVIHLTVDMIDIVQQSSKCEYGDHVMIVDGNRLIGVFCGISPPDDLVSEARIVFVDFRSVWSPGDKGEGFLAKYEQVNDEFCGFSLAYPAGVFGSFDVDGESFFSYMDETCFWKFEPTNEDFVTGLRIIDMNIDCSENNLKLFDLETEIGEYCGSVPPTDTFYSSTLLVQLDTWQNLQISQFTIAYASGDSQCVAILTDETSNFTSPDADNDGIYDMNTDCIWVIVSPLGNVIQFTFDYMDIEYAAGCRYDFIAFYDTNHSPENSLGVFCGSDSVTPIISLTNILIVRFVADSYLSLTGFSAFFRFTSSETTPVDTLKSSVVTELETAVITEDTTTTPTDSDSVIRECGGEFWELQLTFMPPDSNADGKHDASLMCVWKIYAAENKLIKLTIDMMEIAQQYDKCEWGDHLQITDGNIVKGLFCGTSPPGEFISETRIITLYFQSIWSIDDKGAGFLANYEQINDPVCGFTLPYDAGFFGSFDVDDNGFFSDTEDSCFWTIPLSVDNFIAVLRITDMDIVCNKNTLKILDDATEIGEYCGTVPPAETFSAGTLRVQLKRWTNIEHSKFTIVYATGDQHREGTFVYLDDLPALFLHETEEQYLYLKEVIPFALNGPFLIVRANDCTYILSDESITFTSPDKDDDGAYDNDANCIWVIVAPPRKVVWLIFKYMDIDCPRDFITLYDTNVSPENSLGTFCGDDEVSPVTSPGNILIVTFETNNYGAKVGFSATYKFIRLSSETTSEMPTEEVPTTDVYTGIFTVTDTEKTVRTTEDTTSTTKYTTTPTELGVAMGIHGYPLHRNVLVMQNHTARFVTGNYIKPGVCLTFSNGRNRNTGGEIKDKLIFKGPKAGTGCGGSLRSKSGTFFSPDSDNDGLYDETAFCIWQIHAPNKERIRLQFTAFELEPPDGTCLYDYLKIKDGNKLKGKYCGTEKPSTFVSESGVVAVEFVSDDLYSFSGFTAQYKLNSVDFSEWCNIYVGHAAGQFTSEQYSGPFSCIWTIMGDDIDSLVQLYITYLDIQSGEDCSDKYLEIFDDQTLVGKYCGTSKPPLITSTLNVLYLQFTVEDNTIFIENTAFRAAYLIHGPTCGGLMLEPIGTLGSPDLDQDQKYDADVECVWMLLADQKTVRFDFSFMDIDGTKCTRDRLEFFDGGFALEAKIDTYCGNYIPSPINSINNALLVRFISDQYGTGAGFEGTYTHSHDIKGCVKSLNDSSGTFASPDSNGDGIVEHKSFCVWQIQAAENRVIWLKFDTFQIQPPEGVCYFGYVTIWDGSVKKGSYCGTDKPEAFVSDSRVVTIEFVSDNYQYAYTGFRGRYKQIMDPTCGYQVSYPAGEFGIDNMGILAEYGDDEPCVWKVTGTEVDSVAQLYITSINIQSDDACSTRRLEIHNSEGLLGQYCGSTPPSLITSDVLFVHLIAGGSDQDVQFRARYLTHPASCGGLLTEPTGILTSPDEDQNGYYDKSVECVWMLLADDNQIVQFKITHMDLYGPHCRRDRLEFFDGSFELDAQITTVCSQNIPPPVISTTSILMVRFISDRYDVATGFQGNFTHLDDSEKTSIIPVTTKTTTVKSKSSSEPSSSQHGTSSARSAETKPTTVTSDDTTAVTTDKTTGQTEKQTTTAYPDVQTSADATVSEIADSTSTSKVSDDITTTSQSAVDSSTSTDSVGRSSTTSIPGVDSSTSTHTSDTATVSQPTKDSSKSTNSAGKSSTTSEPGVDSSTSTHSSDTATASQPAVDSSTSTNSVVKSSTTSKPGVDSSTSTDSAGKSSTASKLTTDSSTDSGGKSSTPIQTQTLQKSTAPQQKSTGPPTSMAGSTEGSSAEIIKLSYTSFFMSYTFCVIISIV